MFSFPDASRELKTHLELSNLSSLSRGVSIDTRSLKPGDMFVALRGSQQDGHLYLEEAFRKGASGALIEKAFFKEHRKTLFHSREIYQNILPVDDPQQSLLDLAQWYRKRFETFCIGITGSVGKTTTKEFLAYLLSKKFRVMANQGNFNNHLGLPLTLFRLAPSHDYCVAELGANHPGEIAQLSAILRPDLGVITQIAPVHLEGFGSLDEIYNQKLQLFAALKPGRVAIVPDDDPKLEAKAAGLRLNIIKVGPSEQAKYRITNLETRDGFVHFELNGSWKFSFPGIASFLSLNAAMAVAAAREIGMPWHDIPSVWDDVVLPAGRFQIRDLAEGVQAIYDGYNASPVAFRRALESFESYTVSGKKILVFADMLELGNEAEKYHQELGRQIAKSHLDYALAYGPLAKKAMETLKEANPCCATHYFEGCEETAAFLKDLVRPGDCILLKASRSMRMDRVLEALAQNSSSPNLK